MQDIEFNGILGSTLQIFARDLIKAPAAEPNLEEVKVAGRDGTIYRADGTYKSKTIQVAMNYIGPEERWNDRWRLAKQWLSARNTILKLSDDGAYFYKITHVSLDSNERTTARVGNFTAKFVTLDGLQYLVNGQTEYPSKDVEWNPYIECHPVYKIEADGMCTLSVNGNVMTANVAENLTIDTDRMIAYRLDGTLNNTKISGNYEDLYLKPGENKIEFTGGTLSVVPNWRCL